MEISTCGSNTAYSVPYNNSSNIRPHRSSSAKCGLMSPMFCGLCVVGHNRQPYKNGGWTDRGVVWNVDSNGQGPRIRWVCGSPHEKNHLGGKCPVLGMLRRVGGRRTQRTGRCSQGGSGDATSATSTVATCYCHHDCWMWLLWRHCPARSLTVPVQGTAYCGLLIISRP